jgi:predicted dehydrogenase
MGNPGEKLGVAVVGLGIGEQHARAYLATGRCHLRWLYDLQTEKALALQAELGAGGVAASYEAILGDPEVQLVSLASFDEAHFGQVVAALGAGKHVFVEKPLCRSLEELQRVQRAWRQHRGKVKLASNLVLRAAPLYRYAKELLDAGRLGDIYAFDGEYLYGRLEKITHGWRKDEPEYSVILGGGVHLVDLLLGLTGQRPTMVRAVGNRLCSRGTEFRYPDYVAATLTFSSGLIGRITANFGCVQPHQHVVRIFGTKGTWHYDDQGARWFTGRDPASPAAPLPQAALPASKGELIPGFVEAILQETDFQAQTQHEFDIISVCTAIDRALANGECLEVEYV